MQKIQGFAQLLVLAPLLYYALCVVAARRFRWESRRLRPRPNFAPPMSILKPVHGLDRDAYQNFASYCRLDYPEYEILFCAGENDPAIPVIQKVAQDHPQTCIRILVGAEPIGYCDKVNKLCQLVSAARHEWLVMSDSDVCVEPSYLNDIARVLPDPKVGAATVLFRSSIDGSFVSRLEAISAGLDFWASTLLARHVEGGLRFTHGATMVIGRKLLQEMGGWETRVNHSEDDAWLGEQTANRGRAVAIVAQPVWMVYPTRTFREYLSHEVLRYVRIRTTRPLAYVGFVFTHGLPFVVIAALLALSTPWKVADLTVYFLLRSLMVWEVGVGVLDDPVIRRWWWLAPVRDVLGFCVWLAAFGTNRIVWRGHKFRSLPGGKLEPVDPGAGVKKRNPDAQAHLHQGS